MVPVTANSITNTATAQTLAAGHVLVENNTGPDGAVVDDHLQLDLHNTGTTTLSGFQVFYTFTDPAGGTKESYYLMLPDTVTVPAGRTQTFHFDNTGAPDHLAVNKYSLYYPRRRHCRSPSRSAPPAPPRSPLQRRRTRAGRRTPAADPRSASVQHAASTMKLTDQRTAMTALLLLLLTLAWFVLIARVIADLAGSVVPAGTGAHHLLARVRGGLHQVTEPVLAPVRRVLPLVRLGAVALDLSVLVVLVVIAVLRTLLPG